jgi:hypothetical protein
MADRWLSFVEATDIVRRVQNLRGVGSAEAALARWIESRELGWHAPGSPVSLAQMHGWYGPQQAILDIKRRFFRDNNQGEISTFTRGNYKRTDPQA